MSRLQRSGLGWMMALAVVMGLWSPVAAHAEPWMPKPGATFNLPRAGLQQYRIHQQIIGAIDHAHQGSLIRIALFSWDRDVVARAVVRAHHRGVQVQVLLNNHQVTSAQRILHRALGQNRFRKNFAYECTNGCRSSGENLHTKMYLFSATGGAKDVVMTGSVNLTTNSAVNQYNDIWIKNDAPGLYNGFAELFQALRQDHYDPGPYWVRDYGIAYELQAPPYRNESATHDPMISILNKIRCGGATGGTGTPGHHTIVRIVMHAWNDPRGVWLAKKVRQLYANGCDVKILYGVSSRGVRNTWRWATRRGRIPVRSTGYDTNKDGLIDLYTHQKELLVSGSYDSDTSTRMVVTGSSNWNTGGLHGDEEIFLIKKAGAFKQYRRNFDFMWAHRSRPFGSSYVKGARVTTTGSEPRAAGPAWEND